MYYTDHTDEMEETPLTKFDCGDRVAVVGSDYWYTVTEVQQGHWDTTRYALCFGGCGEYAGMFNEEELDYYYHQTDPKLEKRKTPKDIL